MAEATFCKNQTRGFTLGYGANATLTDARYVGELRGRAEKANWIIDAPNEAGEVAVTYQGGEEVGAVIQLIVSVEAQRSVVRATIVDEEVADVL